MNKILQLIIPIAFFGSQASFGQLLTGVVKDRDGSPVVGASVIVKATKIYAFTDVNGNFSFAPPKEIPFSIKITSTGFKAHQIEVFEVPQEPLDVTLFDDHILSEIVVTARRRTETLQQVPIPVSVVGGELIEDAGAFNVNRVKELVPAVQLYSSNPRNSTLNIRGLGSTFGLTNDGIDPGVGFYVDGVYYARPAATSLDFVDIEQIEVLRGPQGTLFGKNTTAGAFNVTSRAPSFAAGATFEVTYGNYGFVQAKTSVTGPLGKKFAARLSFSGTQRDGVLFNVATQKQTNDLNNLGFRGQLLYTPGDNLKITLIADNTRQHPDGYAQVIAGVVPTKRASYRQFDQIIADLGYKLPSRNPFDRKIDHDTPWKSGNELGGVSINLDSKIANGTLTATTAWRNWHWDPSNDRDFTGLPVLIRSEANSRHQQWTQEVRYAGKPSRNLSGVIGIFAIYQELKSDPLHIEESGAAQWRFSQNSTSDLWKTPGLLDGYGIRTKSSLNSIGAAVFGQIDWSITESLHVLPGLRYNFDQKNLSYDRQTYGGLQTNDPELIALKRAVYNDQEFEADVEESNISGQLTVSYHASKKATVFAAYSTSYKPAGLNLGGLPTSNGQVLTELARIKPEYVSHLEAGIKSNPGQNSTLNLTSYHTIVNDYQTQVQTAEIGVNRGYLANAEKIRVFGAELDANLKAGRNVSLYGALAFSNGQYLSFRNAPVPLEETGGESAFKDISGSQLPGISRWAGSGGGEFLSNLIKVFGQDSKMFVGFDIYFRSGFSSSPSPSKYLNIDGYALINARAGFRASEGLTLFVWSRNLLNENYFEQLLAAAGNAGQFAGVLGDPRTYGITLRYNH
ncbi:MAG TPA: TonB-dependent receptor [Chryseosolibacter sp.]|nr:TonB-dependent receptor [Chryseosolibacter sp.]